MNETTETTNEKPAWGLTAQIPDGVKASWGARAIWQRGELDIVWDRQGFAGPAEERENLCKRLNDGILKKVADKARRLHRNFELDNTMHKLTTFYEDTSIIVVGNPNQSYGYLYLAAWLK